METTKVYRHPVTKQYVEVDLRTGRIVARLDPPDLDVSLDSVAIRRLIDEVRHDVPRSYDRIYNRHNR